MPFLWNFPSAWCRFHVIWATCKIIIKVLNNFKIIIVTVYKHEIFNALKVSYNFLNSFPVIHSWFWLEPPKNIISFRYIKPSTDLCTHQASLYKCIDNLFHCFFLKITLRTLRHTKLIFRWATVIFKDTKTMQTF